MPAIAAAAVGGGAQWWQQLWVLLVIYVVAAQCPTVAVTVACLSANAALLLFSGGRCWSITNGIVSTAVSGPAYIMLVVCWHVLG